MATKQMFWSQLLPCACSFVCPPVLKHCSTWKITRHCFSMPNLCRHTCLRHWRIYSVNAHRFACLEKKWIQASARWHYCVVYLSNQCPFPILRLFLSHGSFLSSPLFHFTTHPSVLCFSLPLFSMHSMYVAQLGVEHRTIQSELTWGAWRSQGRPRTESVCHTQPWLHTHSIFIHAKLTIQSQNTLLESETGPFKKRKRKKRSPKGNDKGTSSLSKWMYNFTRKAYVILSFTTEDGHLWVVEGSRSMDKWIGVFGHHGHDRTHESWRLSVAIWTRGQVIVQCWWRLLWHSPCDLDVISHGSVVIKGNKWGLRQKEFSQRFQFNIYFQLSCSPITGSAPPC